METDGDEINPSRPLTQRTGQLLYLSGLGGIESIQRIGRAFLTGPPTGSSLPRPFFTVFLRQDVYLSPTHRHIPRQHRVPPTFQKANSQNLSRGAG